ncbi:MAG: 30S ribosomal protein S21 [Mycoplasmataceae bacterium]|jgi:small subunit ribosomal protein S21|nr:30S ribosomal protein S21 [Mycoplasmataceae bacterium]
MANVKVLKKDFNESLKRFGYITNETKKDMMKHRYHLRPGMKRVEKSKEAAKMKALLKKKANGSNIKK